jgi:hypothetical protein
MAESERAAAVKYFCLTGIEDRSTVRVAFRDEDVRRTREALDAAPGPVVGWEPPRLETYRGHSADRPQDRALYDRSLFLIGGMRPLFDEQLASLLEPILVDPRFGEYLPAFLDDRRFLLYNSWLELDAYDHEASEYQLLYRYKDFTKPVLLASKLAGNPPWFHLPDADTTFYVNETVHDLMMSVGRLGEDLVEVEVLDR